MAPAEYRVEAEEMQGKLTEVRTPKGRMVGTLDARTGTLRIKDGRRITIIEVPQSGLDIRFASGDGGFEQIRVALPQEKFKA